MKLPYYILEVQIECYNPDYKELNGEPETIYVQGYCDFQNKMTCYVDSEHADAIVINLENTLTIHVKGMLLNFIKFWIAYCARRDGFKIEELKRIARN